MIESFLNDVQRYNSMSRRTPEVERHRATGRRGDVGGEVVGRADVGGESISVGEESDTEHSSARQSATEDITENLPSK